MTHGTIAGWNRHMKQREEPCPGCKTARARYMAHRRFVAGVQLDPKRCVCGSVFPDHVCHLGARS